MAIEELKTRDMAREHIRMRRIITAQRLQFLKRVCVTYLTIVVAIQMIASSLVFDFINIGCVAMAGVTALITCFYLFRAGVADRYPISSILIFSLCIANQLIPLGGTLIQWKLLNTNLEFPIDTFLWISIFQLVIIASHFIYLRIPLFRGTKELITNHLKLLSFFTPPSREQLWLFAGAGFLPFVVGGYLSQGDAGFIVKILNAFGNFSYAPMLLPFYHLMYPGQKKPTRKELFAVGGYFCLLMLIGLAVNSRGGIAAAVMVLIYSAMILAFTGILRVKEILLRKKLLLVCGLLVVIFPLSHLALAMQIARKERGKISQSEMIFRTIEVAASPSIMRANVNYNLLAAKKFGWDESYLNNVFLDRFSDVKFHDLGFQMSLNFGEKERGNVKDFIIGRSWGLIPDPVLRQLRMNTGKAFWTSFSFGDYMYYLGTKYELTAGRKTGSQIVNGLVLFGTWRYPFVLFACAIVTFILFDSFSTQRFVRGIGFVGVTISPLVLFSSEEIFRFFSEESMVSYVGLVLRMYLQTVVIYFIMFHATAVFAPARKIRRPQLRSSVETNL